MGEERGASRLWPHRGAALAAPRGPPGAGAARSGSRSDRLVLEEVEDFLGVVGDVGAIDDVLDLALLVDHERDPLGHPDRRLELGQQPRPAERAVGASNLAVGIGEEREVELEFLRELAVRRLVLRRHAEDRRTLQREVVVVVAQRARLLGASGRVVHGIEVKDQLPATEVLERDALAVGGDAFEIGGGVARPERCGHGVSYQWIPWVICANAICSGESSTSLASSPFLPFAAPESGNMRKAVLRMIRVTFGATACSISPKTPSRVAMRTGLWMIASTTRAAACSGVSVGTWL